MTEKLRVGIYGASGYTGWELVRLLVKHPLVDIVFATARTYAGQSLRSIDPLCPDLPLIAEEQADLSKVDAVFLCLPHTAAANTAAQALQAGVKVIDLSADFRLKDPSLYPKWYKYDHPQAHLLPQAVYGLTEIARPNLPGAALVANPGCYATAITLALLPAIQAQWAAGTIIADAKSGVSGAGRNPRQDTHFVEAADNLSPYKIGRSHQHIPEIEQTLRQVWATTPGLIFSPYLLPVPRGILATLYVPLTGQNTLAAVHECYQQAYANEPCIWLLPPAQVATLRHANYTNRCVLGLTLVDNMLIVTSAIDNLLKGAAGQALQNFNLVWGIPETTALPL